ncbi:trimeric intracellular cation channel family protein, partial [Bacillus vallismortis]|nr:trimeric intracellular cation channel family protein [Bacillus vallismortis]
MLVLWFCKLWVFLSYDLGLGFLEFHGALFAVKLGHRFCAVMGGGVLPGWGGVIIRFLLAGRKRFVFKE